MVLALSTTDGSSRGSCCSHLPITSLLRERQRARALERESYLSYSARGSCSIRYVSGGKRLCLALQEDGRMAGGRRGLVAPQNTFLENIVRRSNGRIRSGPVRLCWVYTPDVWHVSWFCSVPSSDSSTVMGSVTVIVG